MKESTLSSLGAFLVSLLLASTVNGMEVQQKPQGTRSVQKIEVRSNTEDNSGLDRVQLRFVKGKRFRKTTREECEIRGGEYAAAHANLLPQDMVDCAFPYRIRRLGKHVTYSAPREILGSVYDYLYKVGIERPRLGLYSYVLLPVHSPRADRILEELFKTTSFVELSGISLGNLNLIYLPTRTDKLSGLIPVVSDGSAPPVSSFATEFYDYALARKLLSQICTAPAEAIRDVCATDLSRGPYLFSYSHPISALSLVPPPYLFVDLSSVHELAFGEFVSAYKEQIKRSDYTDLKRIDNLRLRLLSIVLTAADWTTPIKGAIAEILHVAKGEGDPEKPSK